jgi:hypothetical protein
MYGRQHTHPATTFWDDFDRRYSVLTLGEIGENEGP